MRLILFFGWCLYTGLLLAQDPEIKPQGSSGAPKTADSLKQLVARLDQKMQTKDTVYLTIKDYKIISARRDTTHVDTTMSFAQDKSLNYLRRDAFAYLPMSNMGQPRALLSLERHQSEYAPLVGASAWQDFYWEAADMRYYHVPTPLSEMTFKTSIGQGHYLDALIALNTSKRFNLSIAHTGFRSQGDYLYDLAKSSSFRMTANYRSEDQRYGYMAHVAGQKSLRAESGGLVQPETQFESNDPTFANRLRIDQFFSDAQSTVVGKRYYMDQWLYLTRLAKPGTQARKSSLSLGLTTQYETRFVQFTQSANTDYFGPAYASYINDKAQLKQSDLFFSTRFQNPLLGDLKAEVGSIRMDYRSMASSQSDQLGYQGTEWMLGGTYRKNVGIWQLDAFLRYTLSGSATAYQGNATLLTEFSERHRLTLGAESTSRWTDWSQVIRVSDYEGFGWDHRDDWTMPKQYALSAQYQQPILGLLTAKAQVMDSQIYFGLTMPEGTQVVSHQDLAPFVRPMQTRQTLKYLQLSSEKTMTLGRWTWDHRMMFQKVDQSDPVYQVPEWNVRASLYYTKEVFRKAMELQTGITARYFSSFYMNGYHPLLGTFYTQDQFMLGGTPMLDLFFHAKVDQTRFFLKAEHFNAPFSTPNYYSAPGFPYRDFVIRFGFIWNFFS